MLATHVSLAYVDVGPRSSDVLVLLPGLSDSWRSYELVLPHLASTFRTIAVSQRGHGDSDKPESGYTVRDFAADLNALLDALAIRRAVIAGHSSASIVARRFALDHPEMVAGLVLEGSFVKLGQGAARFGARVASLEDPISHEFARDFASATFGRPVSKEFLDAMIEESLKAPARVWRETFASLLDYDDSAEAAKLDVRTLVVWGTRTRSSIERPRMRLFGRSGIRNSWCTRASGTRRTGRIRHGSRTTSRRSWSHAGGDLPPLLGSTLKRPPNKRLQTGSRAMVGALRVHYSIRLQLNWKR